eukprot:7749144-Lingulodinium_polyedra.AAC.1
MKVVQGIRADLGEQKGAGAPFAAASSSKKKVRKKKKKGKRRKGSSDSSSRSTSRSSSGSSGSSMERKSKYLRWDSRAKSQDVTTQQVVSLDSVKFRKKGDLQ